jgi:hypothetical protein
MTERQDKAAKRRVGTLRRLLERLILNEESFVEGCRNADGRIDERYRLEVEEAELFIRHAREVIQQTTTEAKDKAKDKAEGKAEE